MDTVKSADCREWWHEACESTPWCRCFCHDDDRPDDDRHERETSEDDHIMFG